MDESEKSQNGFENDKVWTYSSKSMCVHVFVQKRTFLKDSQDK